MPFPIPKLPNAIPQITLEIVPDGGDYDQSSGAWVENPGTAITFSGSILPIQDKEFYSEGVYSRGDKKVYTDDPALAGIDLTVNMFIRNPADGKTYVIDLKNPYTEIEANFKRFFVKRRRDTNR